MAIFLALTGISMIIGGLISFSIVAAVLHVNFSQIQEVLIRPENVKLAQFANAFASLIAFGVPATVDAYLCKGSIKQNMGFAPVKSGYQIGVVILLAFSGLLLSGALGDLTQKIPIPSDWKVAAERLEAQYKKALLAMTQMKSLFDLLVAIIAVAVVPAIVEELYFRAGLQKILINWSGKPHLAIIITAIVFSTFHFSYFGFLSRMSLGTIWLPMLMHFLNNLVGISTLYFVKGDPKKVDAVLEQNLTFYWVFVALILVYLLLRRLNIISNDTRLEKSI
jgi:membrane protease YdiL (CAAX protease family)